MARRRGPDVGEVLARLEAVHGATRLIARFDPLEELVSCIMSQHTTDANSFPAFTRLRTAFPTWEDVMAAGPERVADVIRKAGLPNQKAKSILRTLARLVDAFGEPTLEPLRTMSDDEALAFLQSLPGVGPKTASLVLCFSFGRGTIPVDTHIYRVGWRLGWWDDDLGEPKAHLAARQLVPQELAFRFHTALIQHGRVICRAPLPDCPRCPALDVCRWARQGGPAKRERALQRTRQAAVRRRSAGASRATGRKSAAQGET